MKNLQIPVKKESVREERNVPGRKQGSRLQGCRDGTMVPGFSGYQESVDSSQEESVKRNKEQVREDEGTKEREDEVKEEVKVNNKPEEK